MKLTEMYKDKMMSVLTTMYGDKIDINKAEAYIDNAIANSRANNVTLWMRNLYTTKNFGVKLDDILNIIEKEDLCIEANNTLTYSLNKVESPIPKILIKNKADRNLHKKKMLAFKEEIGQLKAEGKFFEGCPADINCKLENGYQLKIKVFMNSIYGVQGQRGSIIYAPDTAGAVTSQGRELIAEMTWTMERLLYGTLHNFSSNELFCYIDTIKHEVHPDSPLLSYITYWPTVHDVQQRLIESIHITESLDENIEAISISLYNFIHSLTPVERVYFYYKNHMFDLYSKNPKVFALFDQIIKSPTEFISTAPGYEGHPNPGYDEFMPIINQICGLLDEFVICKMSTPKRTKKYQTKRRRGIVVSDTDSVIINLHPHVANLYKLHCLYNNEPYKGEHVGFHSESLDFKLVNVMATICVHATVIAGDILVKQGHVPQELRKWIDMKNEFLFKRLLMYTNAKKNYIVNVRLQEGKVIDDVSVTGIKMNSSTIHPMVKEKMLNIITDELLKTENPNPIKVMLAVKDIEKSIIDGVVGGDLTLGKKARYSGVRGYKTGVYASDAGRSAYIWNLFYPNARISTGDYGYIFNTTLYTKDDVMKKLYPKFPKEAEMVIKLIFENTDKPDAKDSKLAQYGLRSIMIPVSESVKKIPEWLIPFIDYPKLTNKHLQPLISLLPSVSLKLSAISSSKCTYSPLITFN